MSRKLRNGRASRRRRPRNQAATRELLGLKAGDGSLTRFAKLLNITPQAIDQWKVVPLSRVKQIEELTGIPRHKLRPDYYDRPARFRSRPRTRPPQRKSITRSFAVSSTP